MPRQVAGVRATCKSFARRVAPSAVLLLVLSGCSEDSATPVVELWDGPDLREVYDLETLELSDVDYPIHNSPAEPGYDDRVELGRLLFFDPVLSGRGDISCGHCHHPAMAWVDGNDLSPGVSGEGLGPDRELTDDRILLMPRNTPTSLNVGLSSEVVGGPPSRNGVLFWDGRASSLEVQAFEPTATIDEMSYHLPNHDEPTYPDSMAADHVMERLRDFPGYVEAFREGFPLEAAEMDADPVDLDKHVIRRNTFERAIGAYQRELITIDSPYDEYVRGDDRAMTIQQMRGAELYYGEANCAACHGGPMFSDYSFSRLGVKDNPRSPGRLPTERGGSGTGVDVGRQENSGDPRDYYKFRVPSLRNVELTGPWFRHGQAESLREVVIFHALAGHEPDPVAEPERHAIWEKYMGGNALGGGFELFTPDQLDPRLRPVDLTDEQVDDIVAFLRALTDRTLDGRADPRVPDSVPSGMETVEKLEPFSMVPFPQHMD